MSLPRTVVELFLGGVWTDVSVWCDLGDAPVSIKRGRDNEQSDVTAGTCAFSLVNDDGRFTLANTSGAYSPNFKLWIQVRVTINGVREFTGYMSNAETTWDDNTGANSHTAVTCTDLLGMMTMSPNVRSWADALIGSLSPLYWWKLNDADGSTSAAEANGGMALTPTIIAGARATSDLITFGADGPGSLEADAMVHLQGEWDDTTYSEISTAGLVAPSGLAGLTTSTTGFTILCMYYNEGYDYTVPNTVDSALFRMVSGDTNITAYASPGAGWDVNQWWTGSPAGPGYAIWPRTGFGPGKPSLFGMTVTTTTITTLGLVDAPFPAGRTFTRNSAATMNGAMLSLGVAGDLVPFTGRTQIAHFAIINGTMSEATFSQLSAKLAAAGSGPVLDWLNRGASEAGYPLPATATYNRTMERPVLKGSNPAAMGASLASAAGAMFVALRDGTPKWIDLSYCPAAAPIAMDHVSTPAWAPDSSTHYTEVQMDDVTVATMPGSPFPRQAMSLPGLLTATDQAAYADWLIVNAETYSGPRLSSLTVDLLTVDSGSTDTYQAIDLRDRVYLTDTPTQVTAGVMTCEGYTLTAGVDVFTKTLNTAPDPRFVLGESVLGDSRYHLFPAELRD